MHVQKPDIVMKIAVGSDERTVLTDTVIAELQKRGHEVELYGPLAGESLAWPAVGQVVAERVTAGACQEGVLFCWTGTGVSIAANKVPGVRAALCADAETAKGARLWNHANVLVLSLRATSQAVALETLDAWLAAPWGDKPEDMACVAQVAEIERKYGKETCAS
jgi:ribose 5-phosphate isomerase B